MRNPFKNNLSTAAVVMASNRVFRESFAEDVGPEVLKIVEAARLEPLNRYNIRPGRIFGNLRSKDRYQVLDVTSNSVVYKDLVTDKVRSENINVLLEKWNISDISELSLVDTIIDRVKKLLTPFLGGVLVATLITWLHKKLF